MKDKVQITKSELRAILWWASVGYSRAISGSHPNIPEIATNLAKKHKISLEGRDFQQGDKLSVWVTSKDAYRIWEALGKSGEATQKLMREFYLLSAPVRAAKRRVT